MKSEGMSKKDVKRRLDNLFGEYSAFVVKPNEQQQPETDQNASEGSRPVSPNLKARIDENKIQGNRPNKELQNGSGSSLCSIIGQITNVPRPLSPVNQVHITSPNKMEALGREQVQQSQENSKDPLKMPKDLKTLFEQISQVSPLLSPLHFDYFSPDIDEYVPRIGGDAKVEGTENCRKRPNTETIARQSKMMKTVWPQEWENGKEGAQFTHYSIKLCAKNYQKLVDRMNSKQRAQRPIKNGSQAKSDSISKKLSAENFITLATTAENGQLNSKMSFVVPPNTPPLDYFSTRARDAKKRAEKEMDRVLQVLLCFESIAYSIMVSNFSKKPEKMHSSLADASNFLNSSWMSFKRHKFADHGPVSSVRTRLKYLQMMVSACLAYHLFHIRSSQALSTYSVLTRYEKENPVASRRPASRTNGNESAAGNANGGTTSTTTCTTTPSPAASTPGSLNAQSMVTLPMDIYSSMSQQIRTLHHLMWSFKLWKDAKSLPPECKGFVEELDGLCGPLKQDSELVDVAEYLLTAVQLLSREYSKNSGKR